ncbi:MAG: flagellar basal-body MS-ring/collar protein FliF [Myxococcota bacterium]
MSEPESAPPATRWPEPVQRYVDRARDVWRQLPPAAKVVGGAMLATAIAVAGWTVVGPVVADQAVLFSQLERSDAATIVEKLKAQGVRYRLTGDGETTIMVPADQVHELRLQMASEGLPQGGTGGFDDFQNMRLGATEFEQHVTYRRAMEGELARTISDIRAVKNARVHLVMPRKSVFAQKREPASASVVVSLTGVLDREEVASIIHLVATAVPDLNPDRIALVSTRGEVLHRPRGLDGADRDATLGPEGGTGGASAPLETLLADKARAILERTLGPGHVDVQVSAEVENVRVESKSDIYDEASSAIISEQREIEKEAGGAEPDLETAGVPGAESNLPTGADDVGAAAEVGPNDEAGVTRKRETINHQPDRTTTVEKKSVQVVKRLSVAVLVDGVPGDPEAENGNAAVIPRSAEELDKLQALVAHAVGFDAKRGDTITIHSAAFVEEALPEPTPEPKLLPLPEPYASQVEKFTPLAKLVAGLVAGLVGALWFRGWNRRRKKAAAKRAKQLAAAATNRAALTAATTSSANEPERIDYKVEALERATTDPATAALVVRHWLGTAVDATDESKAA